MAGTNETGIGAEPTTARPTFSRAIALELKDEHSEIPRTRRAVHDALRHWGFDALADDLGLLASELVTNALRHGKQPVTVLLRLCDGLVHLEVNDASPAEPEIREPDPERGSGQGLLLVRAFSDEWGWQRKGPGKTVWCKRRQKPPSVRAVS
ncbi:ATP-binding protein [Streptomyces sp. NPDC059003]|uniref:ATP-binding protein n=1 Tax=Streptomyces sp. NPDC059003 TaxID=3346691 RepID=UPI0036C041F6